MTNIHHKNELIKRKFYEYLANSKSVATIECLESAIWLWEDFTDNADFTGFNKNKATEFKTWLKDKKKKRSEEKVSLSYCYDNLRHLRTFFTWLSKQKGYRSMIETDIDYLNLPKGEARIATQSKGKIVPSLEEIKTVIESIEGKTEIEMRDKALLSLLFLTGARIQATTSLPMESFDKERMVLIQDPKWGVKTKNSKRIVSLLIPFSYKEPLGYFIKWFDYLKEKKEFRPQDPLFPATKVENGSKDTIGYFSSELVSAVFWKSTSSPRKILEKRFKQANVRYYRPHSFRHLLVREVSKLPLTEEQKKALSQNMGHEYTGTTFGVYGYGQIDEERQIEIIRNIDFEGKKYRGDYVLTGREELRELLKEIKADKKDETSA